MAHNKNIKKSEGLCQKIHNAVSPFRARIRRISHQPQGSISIISNEKPLSQNTQPVRISSPQTEPVRVLHQPSPSRMIPVEFEPSTEREVEIVNSQEFAKFATKKEKFSQPENEDDENKFSDYISRVRDRMMTTASNVSGGAGGGGETSPIRDSFNDKVTNYINRTKIKVRKTTSVGDGKSFSLK